MQDLYQCSLFYSESKIIQLKLWFHVVFVIFSKSKENKVTVSKRRKRPYAGSLRSICGRFRKKVSRGS